MAGKTAYRWQCLAVIIAGVLVSPVIAEEPIWLPMDSSLVDSTAEFELEESLEKERAEEPSDLTLWNFFSDGWDHRFEPRSRNDRAPRFHLYKVQQPFLDREIRFNHFFVKGADNGEVDDNELNAEIEIPFTRRFMLDFEPGYAWTDGDPELVTPNGPTLRFSTYLQLVDTTESTLNIQFRVIAPSPTVIVELTDIDGVPIPNDRQTGLVATIAGWQDLTRRFNLYRTGISYSVSHLTFVGPGNAGETRNALIYAAAVAKTFTPADRGYFKDFSIFLECQGITSLDGDDKGATDITFVPGLRWNLTREERPWWFMAGVELGSTEPRPFDYTLLFSLIHWFD